MNQKPLVTDASDKRQVRSAEQREKLSRDQELTDIAHVLSTSEGRRFMWRVLTKCKTFESVWENSARIHYNSGQQDLGHFLMAEIAETSEELLFQLMKENKKEKF